MIVQSSGLQNVTFFASLSFFQVLQFVQVLTSFGIQ